MLRYLNLNIITSALLNLHYPCLRKPGFTIIENDQDGFMGLANKDNFHPNISFRVHDVFQQPPHGYKMPFAFKKALSLLDMPLNLSKGILSLLSS